LFGPSGSGKTFSALRIAKGIGGKVAVIDTEYGRAAKYSDRFDFDIAELRDTQRVEDYLSLMREAATGGYDVLIVDSLTHAWQELLMRVDRMAGRFHGNKWAAWSEATPVQVALVNAVLAFPGHVIATMRSKTEWLTEKDEGTGKNKPVRVGLAPQQGKDIEYEFDMLIEMSPAHCGHVLKDTTGKFQDAFIEQPDEAFGEALAEWLSDGEAAPAVEQPKAPPAESLTPAREFYKNAKADDPKAVPATVDDKRRMIQKVKDLVAARENVQIDDALAAGIIGRVVKHLHRKPRVDTAWELGEVYAALEGGRYTLDSGEFIPPPETEEQAA